MSKIKSFGPTDGVADTKTQVGSDYNMPTEAGHISGVLVAGTGVVADKATSGILHIEHDAAKGPFELPFDVGIFKTSGGYAGGFHFFPLDIDVSGGVLSTHVTMSEACKDIIVGVVFE